MCDRFMRTALVAMGAFLGLVAPITPLHAEGPCGTLSLDGEGPHDVLIGETWARICPGPTCTWVGNGRLGICWRERGGPWNFEQLSRCRTTTAPADRPHLFTGPGDDRVAVLRANHLTAGIETRGFPVVHSVELPPGLDFDVLLDCPPDPEAALGPWRDGFQFGLEVDLGPGGDLFQGSPRNDKVASNHVVLPIPPPPVPVVRAPADGATDVLCGREGNDQLDGDEDESKEAQEFLFGGPGTDNCNGDAGYVVSAPKFDVYRGCEEVDDARPARLKERRTCSRRANPFRWP